MKFYIEDEYPEKWINGNTPEPPFPECKAETCEHGFGVWSLEVKDFEELLILCKKKRQNVLVTFFDLSGEADIDGPRLIFTKNNRPD